MEFVAFEYVLYFELEELRDQYFFQKKQNYLQLCLWLKQQNICGVVPDMV